MTLRCTVILPWDQDSMNNNLPLNATPSLQIPIHGQLSLQEEKRKSEIDEVLSSRDQMAISPPPSSLTFLICRVLSFLARVLVCQTLPIKEYKQDSQVDSRRKNRNNQEKVLFDSVGHTSKACGGIMLEKSEALRIGALTLPPRR